jgi:hypothetical protein
VDPKKLYEEDIYAANVDQIEEIVAATKPYATLIDLAKHY